MSKAAPPRDTVGVSVVVGVRGDCDPCVGSRVGNGVTFSNASEGISPQSMEVRNRCCHDNRRCGEVPSAFMTTMPALVERAIFVPSGDQTELPCCWYAFVRIAWTFDPSAFAR